MRQDFSRPRLVLLTSSLPDGAAGAEALAAALGAGDVASVVIDPAGREGAAFQAFAEPLVEICTARDVAALVASDTRVAGRAKADGFHLDTGSLDDLREAVARFAPRTMVGASGFTSRHEALEAGELLPDYLMFGRLGGDRDLAPDPENLALAEWWAEIVEVPCIVLGGADVETLGEAVRTGAEFVALGQAVFADPAPAVVAAKVARANAILDSVTESLAA